METEPVPVAQRRRHQVRLRRAVTCRVPRPLPGLVAWRERHRQTQVITEITVADVLQVADADLDGLAGAYVGEAGFKLVASLLLDDRRRLARFPGRFIGPPGVFLYLNLAFQYPFSHLNSEPVDGRIVRQWKTVNPFGPVRAVVRKVLGDFDPRHQSGDIEPDIGIDGQFGEYGRLVEKLQTPNLFGCNRRFGADDEQQQQYADQRQQRAVLPIPDLAAAFVATGRAVIGNRAPAGHTPRQFRVLQPGLCFEFIADRTRARRAAVVFAGI